jgi:membrane-bound lytic murein transglycosylase D
LEKVSYWSLKLPRETMLYVPRILAAAIVGHFPEHYSFEIEKRSPIPFDTVSINDCIPLDKVGSSIDASPNTIRELNPQLVRWCTPPNSKSYTLKVPQGSREKFLAAYEKMDKTQLVRWHQYKVQKGDKLGQIARNFGLSVADIQAANSLRGTKLSVGQVLVIPMQAGAKSPKKQVSSSPSPIAANAPPDVPEKIIDGHARFYIVRRGDNLSSISRRFGISSQNIMTWNNMLNNKVKIGQKIYLQDPLKKQEKVTAVAKDNSTASVLSYVVKSGDSLWDIARNHEVTVQQLLEWNPGIDKKIVPGMKIRVGAHP